jgi:hypothetical protein
MKKSNKSKQLQKEIKSRKKQKRIKEAIIVLQQRLALITFIA